MVLVIAAVVVVLEVVVVVVFVEILIVIGILFHGRSSFMAVTHVKLEPERRADANQEKETEQW